MTKSLLEEKDELFKLELEIQKLKAKIDRDIVD